MAKPVPVLNLHHFQTTATLHPHLYVQYLKEHLTQYAFVKAPHRHDFYCLFLFTQGSGSHVIDFKEYEVHPGSVFFMSPAQVHTWQLAENTDGYVVFFNAQFYLLDLPHKSLAGFPFFHYTATPHLPLENSTFLTINNLFRHMHEEYRGHERRKEEILNSYLNILLIKLANAYSQTHTPAFSSHLLQQIRQLETLIEEHYLEHKSVEEYADRMNLSVKQLYSICQTALNKSLGTLLHERMLLEARRLLVHTDLSISQIAAQLNYSDNSYFNRFFKKSAGLTPEQFRQQYR
jgi:AraC family transcriptional regulator, transcriptional activator of pobA